MLSQETKAIRALERAFALGPRGAGVAIRLSKAYQAKDDFEKGRKTLEQALERSNDDKQLHLEMAKLLITTSCGDNNRMKAHLQKSFSSGDHNFDARHLLAQFLFSIGDLPASAALFDEIARIAPANWRANLPKNNSLISSQLPRYHGIVVKRDLNYLFIKSSCYPRDVYGRQDAATPDDWQDLQPGTEANFSIRFSRAGPIAVDMKPGRSSAPG